MICSDALARGIDVPEVDIVISYDCARHIKTHIHRVGRTARAGRPGTAITILSSEEIDKFNVNTNINLLVSLKKKTFCLCSE